MIIDAAELKRRHLLRIAGAADKKVYIGPQIVTLPINTSCNLSCRYCWTHAPGNSAHFEKARYFSWEKFLEVVHDCVDLNVDQIHLTGSGEPTIHPAFQNMMRHLEQQPLIVKVFTNATFPLEYCSDVIKADHVIIDLSAVDRQQYMDVQGKDLFDRVINNIKRLVFMRNAEKPEFVIEIAYIINAVNILQIEQMRDMAFQLGVNRVDFVKMNVHDFNKEIALPGGGSNVENKRTPRSCLNGWFNMVINSDGHTSTCCRIHKMPLGDFDQMSLKGIWSSSHMMNMRLLGKYGQIQKMYQACQTCIYYVENTQREADLAGLRAESAPSDFGHGKTA